VPWLLYSCDDGKSLVAVSAPGSKAAPFYFIFSHTDTGYHLSGEGTGDKARTDAALSELKALRDAQIVALIAETKATQSGATKQ
jgi:hypothetical protein